ncbi:MauE/DoxX family redox-associated membrane protein [Chitinophaga ginsengisoli]|uniref:Methylamine utilization protein MauE n=1 Tax=Chitinophaga ginsengisoli TaxID=363837 RepID=A0A2P8G291_9BACT|nr:MauE/DoxX family redox-associated membrane protein [Chitinophaga ginsengisoli]PSL28089.1 methylamine utilization protein MauE [Chitinophaga ginsengisoli]
MNKKLLFNVATQLLILLFTYTGISKLLVYSTFKMQLERQPLTSNFAISLAIILPIAELLIALFLLTNRMKRFGIYGSLGLMLMFTLYVAYMVIFVPHSQLPCSCGGIIKEMNWTQHLYFNILFTIIALLGLWTYNKTSIAKY